MRKPKVYLAFSSRDTYATLGWDRQTGVKGRDEKHGFRNRARWHREAHWPDYDDPAEVRRDEDVLRTSIKRISATSLHILPEWKNHAIPLIREATCMVVLLGTRLEVAKHVRWEIHEAMRNSLPIYLMKRIDDRDRQLTEDQVVDFLERTDRRFPRYAERETERRGRRDPGMRRLRTFTDPGNKRVPIDLETWDAHRRVYPGLSRFLDTVRNGWDPGR